MQQKRPVRSPSRYAVFVFSAILAINSAGRTLAQSPAQIPENASCATPLNLIIDNKYRKTLIQSVGQRCPQLEKVKKISDLKDGAIIISDAKTGELLWSAGTHKGASLYLPKMRYRVYGGITVVDLNLDGIGDQIFFIDTGGQLWRLFINHEDSKESNEPIIEPLNKSAAGGVMAILSGPASKDRRSFYGRPVVGFIQEGFHRYLTVGIGSGSQVLPRGTTVQDRFYALRTNQIYHNQDAFAPLKESSLVNITPGTRDAQYQKTANNGWYIDLPGKGEKSFTNVVLANGYFGFVTYQPSEKQAGEEAVNRIYMIDAVTGEQKRPAPLQNNKPGIHTTLKLVDHSQVTGAPEGSAGPVFVLCAERECFMMPGHTIRQTGWLDKGTSQPSVQEAKSASHSDT